MLGSLAARNDVIQPISHSLQITVKEPAHSLCAGSFAFWLGFLISGNLVEDALPGAYGCEPCAENEGKNKT